MIKQLDNSNIDVATIMMRVFMESYAVEAKLLGAKDFPPLKRPLEGYTKSTNQFYGYYEDEQLSGVIEIVEKPEYTHIQSLVVSPNFFRRGIGSKLIEYVFKHYNSSTFMVETGAKNVPAIQLYERLGFTLIKEFDTIHGIIKVRLERRNS